jgi:hypothetical protein
MAIREFSVAEVPGVKTGASAAPVPAVAFVDHDVHLRIRVVGDRDAAVEQRRRGAGGAAGLARLLPGARVVRSAPGDFRRTGGPGFEPVHRGAGRDVGPLLGQREGVLDVLAVEVDRLGLPVAYHADGSQRADVPVAALPVRHDRGDLFAGLQRRGDVDAG